MTDVEALLREAEDLLHQDIERELEELERGVEPPVVNPEKYEKARAMFEEIMVTDPDNQRAVEGLEICDIMLEVHIPVQYMAPPAMMDIDIEALEAPEPLPSPGLGEEDESAGETAPTEAGPRPKPWDVRRKRMAELRARDQAGMKYTGEVFSEAGENAEQEVESIIKDAKRLVTVEGRDPEDVYNETEEKLRTYQEGLHRSWKGHGPEILEDALERLRKVLGD